MTILSVVLFALGVALLLQSVNSLALYRSKIPRAQQGSAGAKSVWLIVAGVLLVVAGLVLFIMRAMSSG
jgi:Protein of unknown function (DUF3185)